MRSCPQCISPRLSRQIYSSIAPRRPTASFRGTTTSSRSRKFFTSSSSLLRSSHNSETSRSAASAGTSSSSSHGAASPGSGDAVASDSLAAASTSTSTNNTNNNNNTRKRKAARKTAAKNSLRRVAIIAQQPKRTDADHHHPSGSTAAPAADENGKDDSSNVVSAICMAEGFHMNTVVETLSAHGFEINPDGTEFDAHEVVHARAVNGGDIFVFPSGTLVTWSLPLDVVSRQMLRAAQDLHAAGRREVESLDFSTDDGRETSVLRGDAVVLGTRREHRHGDRLDTTLAKIAFSSGLARSTKLAVLESALTAYFESTRRVPALLSQGAAGAGFGVGIGVGVGVPLSRRFILQKTGELLSLRARLNHYSELTDALPDIFWDSRSELGLEGYYEQVGRALDVNVRIRALNQKMDYAQEIATVLRELSSEQHGTRLEWIIILLIAVEVIFEMRHIVREWKQEQETSQVG